MVATSLAESSSCESIAQASLAQVEPPLVVDLDGTLLRSDLLIETGLVFVHDQPQRCLAPLQWLSGGKARLKHELAMAAQLDVSMLPYDASVIEFIREQRARGRRIVLATASHRLLAVQVAKHLPLFDEVIATEAQRNLTASEKRDALVRAYGERGFDYVGNARDDLPVWAAARHAYLANAPAGIERRARQGGNVAGVLGSGKASWRDWTKALRLHQWLKNLLIFVPLLAAHRYSELPLLLDAVMAFFSFGLCASGIYIVNDLLDLRDDRHHARKRLRPFASGQIPILAGLVAAPVLTAMAFGLAAWQLPPPFLAALGTYQCLTLLYSIFLKRLMVFDVITLAGLYTLRVVAGAMALSIPLSFWLLAFSMFMFLSLALVKRYAELFHSKADGVQGKVPGRGYFPGDLQMIATLGAASGYMTIMVLALYINDAHVSQLYRRQELIWLACPLLLTWITRVWMLAQRGEMNEDPVIFAVRDRISLGIGAAMAVVFWAAT